MKRTIFAAVIGLILIAASISYGNNNTQRISVDSAGNQASGNSFLPVFSADSQHVFFLSSASNLVPNDLNGRQDVFMHTLQTGATRRVSVADDGSEANNFSRGYIAVSRDGRYVAFESLATNLVGGDDTNGNFDIFVRDTVSNTTRLVSLTAAGETSFGASREPAISADGRYVAFIASGTMTDDDIGGFVDVVVHDRDLDENGVYDEVGAVTTVIVSIASDGTQANDHSLGPINMSADGRFVTFTSEASNLVENDTNDCLGESCSDIFVHDRDADGDGEFDEPDAISTVRVSISSDGVEANEHSYNPAISADGRYVVYQSAANTLASGDSADCVGFECVDIFLHDRDVDEDGIFDEAGDIATTRVSPNGWASFPHISADGSVISYDQAGTAEIPCLIGGSTTIRYEVATGESACVSTASDGGLALGHSRGSAVSADGQRIAFSSNATNIVEADTNNNYDIFLYTYQVSEQGASFNWVFPESAPSPKVLVRSNVDEDAGPFEVPLQLTQPFPTGGVVSFEIKHPDGTIATQTVDFAAGQTEASYFFGTAAGENEIGDYTLRIVSPLVPNAATTEVIIRSIERAHLNTNCFSKAFCGYMKLAGWVPPSTPCNSLRSQPAMQQVRSNFDNFTTLYVLRDELMAATSVGRYLTGVYNAHTDEMSSILLNKPDLVFQTYVGFDAWLPSLTQLVEGDGGGATVTQEMVDKLEAVLGLLEQYGSAELRATIQRERAAIDPDSFVGKTMDDAWETLNQRTIHTLYVPAVTR